MDLTMTAQTQQSEIFSPVVAPVSVEMVNMKSVGRGTDFAGIAGVPQSQGFFAIQGFDVPSASGFRAWWVCFATLTTVGVAGYAARVTEFSVSMFSTLFALMVLMTAFGTCRLFGFGLIKTNTTHSLMVTGVTKFIGAILALASGYTNSLKNSVVMHTQFGSYLMGAAQTVVGSNQRVSVVFRSTSHASEPSRKVSGR